MFYPFLVSSVKVFVAHVVSDLISIYSSANMPSSCQNTASSYTSSDLFNLDKCGKGILSFAVPDR